MLTRSANKDRKVVIENKYKLIETQLEDIIVQFAEKLSKLVEKYGAEVQIELQPEITKLISLAECELERTNRLKGEIQVLEAQVTDCERQIEFSRKNTTTLRRLLENAEETEPPTAVEPQSPASPLAIKNQQITLLEQKLKEAAEQLTQSKQQLQSYLIPPQLLKPTPIPNPTPTIPHNSQAKMATATTSTASLKGPDFFSQIPVFDHLKANSQYSILSFLGDCELIKKFCEDIPDEHFKYLVSLRFAPETKNSVRNFSTFLNSEATWEEFRNELIKRFASPTKEFDFRKMLYQTVQLPNETNRAYADRLSQIKNFILSFHHDQPQQILDAFKAALNKECLDVFIRGLKAHGDILRLQKVTDITQALEILELLTDTPKNTLQPLSQPNTESFEVSKLLADAQMAALFTNDNVPSIENQLKNLTIAVEKINDRLSVMENRRPTEARNTPRRPWASHNPGTYRRDSRDTNRTPITQTQRPGQLAITYPGFENRLPQVPNYYRSGPQGAGPSSWPQQDRSRFGFNTRDRQQPRHPGGNRQPQAYPRREASPYRPQYGRNDGNIRRQTTDYPQPHMNPRGTPQNRDQRTPRITFPSQNYQSKNQ